MLGDQVDALTALAEKHPDLDLARVAIRGWSFGGWLAGLGGAAPPGAVPLRRSPARRSPTGRCTTPRTPSAIWGCRRTRPDVYAHHSLVELAAEPPARPDDARPMLLVHGMVDDNVSAAHTLRLSAALLASGGRTRCCRCRARRTWRPAGSPSGCSGWSWTSCAATSERPDRTPS